MNRKVLIKICSLLMAMALLAGCGSAAVPSDSNKGGATTASGAGGSEQASAPGTNSFQEKIQATCACIGAFSDGSDYTRDEVYKFVANKFNIDLTLYPLTWDNWGEKNRIWISAGNMPDFTFWDFDYTEYVNYAQQGLVAPLPQGWEQKYPNLNNSVSHTGIQDKIKLDGLTYCLPKTIFLYKAPISKPIDHFSLFYRKDWLQQLGMAPFGDMITLDQLAQYLKGCIEKDPGNLGAGKTLGLGCSYTDIVNLFVSTCNSAWDIFHKVDGKYVWGPAEPSTLEGIKLLKQYYDMGIFDPDFYLQKSRDGNKFASGTCAMTGNDGTIDFFSGLLAKFTASSGKDSSDSVGLTNLLGPDGKWHGRSSANTWAASVFRPKIDEKVMERLLYLFDYIASEEGQELVNYGFEGTDFKHAGDGGYQVLREKGSDGTLSPLVNKYPSIDFLSTLIVLPDDFSFTNPNVSDYVKNSVVSMYTAKEKNGDIIDFDPDLTFFTSDAKSTYSVTLPEEVIRIIMKKDADIAAEWNRYLESVKSIYEPVLNDLNAEFGK